MSVCQDPAMWPAVNSHCGKKCTLYYKGMGGYVGSLPASYGGSLGSNPDIPKKSQMGDIGTEVANTLYI